MGDAESVGGTWGVGDGEALMEQVAAAFGGATHGGLRQAVVAALVEMHNITKTTANKVGHEASSTCRTYLSPRDYLALIQNFVTCVNARRAEVEDQQLHVNAGLSKLRQTQDSVAELKSGLGAKKNELREKESLANKKLQQMVADQNVAEKRKEEAEKMSVDVEKQQVAINSRKAEAQSDLDDAEPALKSAQQSVRSIKKRDLDEIRNLARPPNNVRLTLEIVAVMMGESKLEWGEIRKILSRNDFIPSILNFDVDTLTQKQIRIVQDKYLGGHPDLSSESVTRSSKACGPLFTWAQSQIRYSSVYNRVQPLREEVEQLEQESQVAKDEKANIEAEVTALESSIMQYKDDYATLIRDVEALKKEMETVTLKVHRAESLITSLSQESERWSKSSEGFQTILRSLVGDGLIMAAFLTYSGFFDFKTRLSLMNQWRNCLDVLGLESREHLSMVESLSKASERLVWQGYGLPSDSLSLENGVILEHCVRFPLIIDPSGHATDFAMTKYQSSKIQKTSFLDKAFMKTLAGAVRFGTTLLVENVETVDPVLNPILNKEIQRTGGRSLVRIGTEDVDYSPKFNIILTTKNPAAKLTPDLCSRVTLVNFTVTPASLQSQSMSQIMKAEKPEVEEQRINLLKLQGEQNVKLRELEDQMLSKISAVEGSILDDDRVVAGMEMLMKEGAQVEEQIEKSQHVFKEVQHAISKFEPLGAICRQIFVTLSSMRDLSFLYEFSAHSFMGILEHVLSQGSRGDEDNAQRMAELKKALFQEVAARTGRGLSAEDKMVFALLLARIYKADETIAAGKPDTTIEGITEMITDVFGSSFPWQGRGLSALKVITESEINPTTPLMLCSAPGHDVSGRVESMARSNEKELAAVAMGSSEGFTAAEQYVASASKRGTWVMLKNCHLCTEWLQETLVKKLQSLGTGTHPNFRLFITSEINSKLPTALLRISDVIVAEAPGGIKASLSRFFTNIPDDRFSHPVRNRLYLMLGWVHAVIQERLRFLPTGWTEQYEFTEADATHALDAIDSLIDEASGGKKMSLNPEKLPWDAIRATLCKGVFGGRITKPKDQEVLDNLVNSVFVPECFNVGFMLVRGLDDVPSLPDGSSQDDCLGWIDTLPSYTPPTWIGLDGSAEAERAKMISISVMEKVDRVGKIQSEQ
jgi:dynein heavy chain 1